MTPRRVAPALLLLAACAGPPEPVTSCEAVGPARPVCGFRNPEDLALLPDQRHVLVSEYGGMDGRQPGALALLDLFAGTRRELYRGGAPAISAAGWGDASCPGPPSASFSPHGIDLAPRPDGRVQLLVVQHGGRESVELFEVRRGPGGWELAWRGCALPPPESWLNDVVALPDGGFLVTHMMPRSAAQSAVGEGADPAAAPPGHVLEWQPGRGFAVLPGSEAGLPNGIEVSADGETVYLNATMDSALLVIERRSGTRRGRVPLPKPDNSTWAPDGRLLVASLLGSVPELVACEGIAGACPAAFQIVAVDPESLATTVLYRNAGAPMGAGTVGLRVRDELLIGSFAGDRILRVALPR